ncbi:rCG29383 [Rattus norvegicus]|uniref:RCG29383 n=1 Tax=Rattus norvegicus TaxID=10116 RepID=A6K855_RAT|nr:rCG29383 [Rattus norvegicus]
MITKNSSSCGVESSRA